MPVLKEQFTRKQIVSMDEAIDFILAYTDAVDKRAFEKVVNMYDHMRGFIFMPHEESVPIMRKKFVESYYESFFKKDMLDFEIEDGNWAFPVIEENSISCVSQAVMSVKKDAMKLTKVVKTVFVLRKTPSGLKIGVQYSNFPYKVHQYFLDDENHNEILKKELVRFGKDSLHRRYKAIMDETPMLAKQLIS